MATHRLPTALFATLGFATLGFASAPPQAFADEPLPPPEVIHTPAAEILESLDVPEDEKGWLSVHLDRMNVHEKYGLTYTHRLQSGDKPLSFTIRGPVLAKPLSNRRRRIGLSIKIRF